MTPEQAEEFIRSESKRCEMFAKAVAGNSRASEIKQREAVLLEFIADMIGELAADAARFRQMANCYMEPNWDSHEDMDTVQIERADNHKASECIVVSGSLVEALRDAVDGVSNEN